MKFTCRDQEADVRPDGVRVCVRVRLRARGAGVRRVFWEEVILELGLGEEWVWHSSCGRMWVLKN